MSTAVMGVTEASEGSATGALYYGTPLPAEADATGFATGALYNSAPLPTEADAEGTATGAIYYGAPLPAEADAGGFVTADGGSPGSGGTEAVDTVAHRGYAVRRSVLVEVLAPPPETPEPLVGRRYTITREVAAEVVAPIAPPPPGIEVATIYRRSRRYEVQHG